MVTVNHMNHDVAEANGSDPSMLPGSFLYEKEPGYEATVTLARSFYAKPVWNNKGWESIVIFKIDY